jgi:hypothetical protein
MMGAHKPIYPRKATIERAIAAARAAGIKVGGFEIDADGTIRIMSEKASSNDSAYDRWQAKKAKA